MIRIALVSYLNTKPFLDGLERAFSPDEIELQLLPPADCAKAMRVGSCELALLPVGSLLDFRDLEVMNHFCIGAEGAVDSVFMFSQVPVEQVDTLVLDPHSRTSNGLAKVLFKEFWKRAPLFVAAQERDLDVVHGNTAAVLIGDLAHAERHRFPYVYDLAAEWKKMTGLPFVFAVWVYKSGKLDPSVVHRIERGLLDGWVGREASALKWGVAYGYSLEESKTYICDKIQFIFDDAKHQAMGRYFDALLRLTSFSSAERD